MVGQAPPPSDPMRRRGSGGGALGHAWVVLGMICGVLIVALGVRDGQPIDVVTGVVVIAVCAVLSLPSRRWIAQWWSGRRPTPDLDAPVVIFWRRDDLRSVRLRQAVGDLAHRAVWVNTWSSKVGEQRVRAINGGEETIPTVLVNGQVLSPANVELVREAILAHTAELADTRDQAGGASDPKEAL